MTFSKELEFMLSKFSHELRNPLTTLYSTIQLIELQHPEVKSFKYWSNLTFDIEYMNQLLDQFSDFSKSQKLQLTSFSMRAMLEQLLLSFATTIVDTDVHFVSKIAPSINQITGDKTKLQEVFLNLLKNAYEASFSGKSIYFFATSDGQNIRITIRDEGCGISDKQLPTVFEPFVTYKKQGTGLGLPICKHIIEAHKGSISVESAVNLGTTVTVTLPAACADSV